MTTKNVRDLLPGDSVVPKSQSERALNSDTDPEVVATVMIRDTGVLVTYGDGWSDEYTHDDVVEVTTALPTKPLELRWRGSVQKWVLNIQPSGDTPLPAVVVEINGRPAFDGTPKPLPTPAEEPPAESEVP